MGCQFYLKRLSQLRKIKIIETRDANPKLSIPKRKELEAASLEAKLSAKDYPIILDMHGQTFSSEELASYLQELDHKSALIPTFIIGGPFGLDQSLISKARCLISLSNLTFTHELARLLLLEQIYRAQCILNHLPYHHW